MMLGLVAPASSFQPPCRLPTHSFSEGRLGSGSVAGARTSSAPRRHGAGMLMKQSQQGGERVAWGVVLGKGLQKLGPLAGLMLGIRPWMGPVVHAEEAATTKTLEASATKVRSGQIVMRVPIIPCCAVDGLSIKASQWSAITRTKVCN